VRRPLLFWGKATVGLGIYAIATCIPFLILAAGFSMSVHASPPFGWRMVLPFLSNLLFGFVCYFAGFFGGLGESRRTLIGGGAIALLSTTTLAAAFLEIREFLAASVFTAAALMAVAGRATFVARGRYLKSKIDIAVTGLLVAIGLGLSGLAATCLVVVPFKDGFRRIEAYTSYLHAGDGTIMEVHHVNGNAEARDLEGRPVERLKGSDDLDDFISDTLRRRCRRRCALRFGSWRSLPRLDPPRLSTRCAGSMRFHAGRSSSGSCWESCWVPWDSR
jgi:hypothetical protein